MRQELALLLDDFERILVVQPEPACRIVARRSLREVSLADKGVKSVPRITREILFVAAEDQIRRRSPHVECQNGAQHHDSYFVSHDLLSNDDGKTRMLKFNRQAILFAAINRDLRLLELVLIARPTLF